MTDKKKFWLTTVIYLVVFWILPVYPAWADKFLSTSFALIYFLGIIPLAIALIYLFLLHNLNLKFKKTLFIALYIILPYVVSSSLVFVFIKMISSFNPG